MPNKTASVMESALEIFFAFRSVLQRFAKKGAKRKSRNTTTGFSRYAMAMP